jgi:hypothetical protein
VEGLLLLLLLLLLPHSYNVNNSIILMEDLKQVSVEPRLRMCSFDIDNMYPNIPNSISCGINTLVKTIVEQNYFQYN